MPFNSAKQCKIDRFFCLGLPYTNNHEAEEAYYQTGTGCPLPDL